METNVNSFERKSIHRNRKRAGIQEFALYTCSGINICESYYPGRQGKIFVSRL